MKLALNPFKKGKKTEFEGIRKVEFDSSLEKALDIFHSLQAEYDARGCYVDCAYKFIEEVILSPKSIDNLLQYMIQTGLAKDPSQYGEDNVASSYITRLIRDSYLAGNNDFVLNVQNEKIKNIGRKLKAKKNNPLKLTINGDVGSLSAHKSENCNITINGNTELGFGSESVNSYFIINGDTSKKSYICGRTEDCTFVINGNLKGGLGRESINSRFYVNGIVNGSIGEMSRDSYFYINDILPNKCIVRNIEEYKIGEKSKKSVYQTSNPKVYEILLEHVPTSNTVELVDENKEIIWSETK